MVGLFFWILLVLGLYRMALELGLNREPDLEESSGKNMSTNRWTEQELQRRVFWAVFTLDK